MNHLHAAIDAHAASAQFEIQLMAAKAMREIKRKAEHPNRSAGQKRRYSKEKAK